MPPDVSLICVPVQIVLTLRFCRGIPKNLLFMSQAKSITRGTASAMERHVQTILAGIITILLSWVGVTLTDSTSNIARLEERLVSLGREVQMLRNQLGNQYTHRDAEKDLAAIRIRLNEHQERISQLEQKN